MTDYCERLDDSTSDVLAPLPLFRVTFLHVRNSVKYEVTVGAWNQYRARKAGETALAVHVALTAGHVADWAWYGTAEVKA